MGPGPSITRVARALAGTVHFPKTPLREFSRAPKIPTMDRPGAIWTIMQSVPDFLLRALRAHVPLFRKSLTRNLYRKKITENALYVP